MTPTGGPGDASAVPDLSTLVADAIAASSASELERRADGVVTNQRFGQIAKGQRPVTDLDLRFDDKKLERECTDEREMQRQAMLDPTATAEDRPGPTPPAAAPGRRLRAVKDPDPAPEAAPESEAEVGYDTAAHKTTEPTARELAARNDPDNYSQDHGDGEPS